ncbi:Gamma-soluble NSF attachment protein [Chelonia mydas]|uniref:Gamma-soluble NSF attachment protein n=1 Tax=Chelonia mydas TaxID=8469 RepID=M7B8G5_CHEMY|nr:Gamma-soluble NSF attachment protein [Chelonia mydas]
MQYRILPFGLLYINIVPDTVVLPNFFLQEMQKLPEAVQLIEKASTMYLENGTPDTAAIALERAGKLIESMNPEKAVQLYQQTASVFENEERLRQAVELLGKASRLLVRGRSIPGFNGSEDCAALEQLLEGYDNQDQDQVSNVCNSPLFKYMDNDYAKLALSLAVPGGGTKKKSPVTTLDKAGGPAAVGSHAEEEDDEYSGGLC